mmetsp:Transcript_10368/g.26946  ORF Transcript_10368/g.26946 Transcript_10368/m.26946 type:complete len:241 (-) Transcript_10368:851-1573(-)
MPAPPRARPPVHRLGDHLRPRLWHTRALLDDATAAPAADGRGDGQEADARAAGRAHQGVLGGLRPAARPPGDGAAAGAGRDVQHAAPALWAEGSPRRGWRAAAQAHAAARRAALGAHAVQWARRVPWAVPRPAAAHRHARRLTARAAQGPQVVEGQDPRARRGRDVQGPHVPRDDALAPRRVHVARVVAALASGGRVLLLLLTVRVLGRGAVRRVLDPRVPRGVVHALCAPVAQRSRQAS